MTVEALITELESSLAGLPPDSLRADTRFRELPVWDSLAALSILAAVDAVLGVQLNGEQLRQCQTIQDIFNLASSRRKA